MVKIYYSPEFLKQVKHLAKKYKSLAQDLSELRNMLMDNPYCGTDLGSGVRKVRMSIRSKGKGKSGGARVITLLITKSIESIDITLLTIYDKSEIASISDKEIKKLIERIAK